MVRAIGLAQREGFRVGVRFIKADLHPRVIYKSESATSELFKDPGAVQTPPPSVIDVEVPADGIHLEVAPGACVLPSVPEAGAQVNLSIQNASLGVKGG